MTEVLIVTAAIIARTDSFEPLLAASLAHAAHVRGLPGCIEYQVAVDATDRLRLVFFERWADAATLSAHFGSAETQDYMLLARKLVASADGLTVYTAKPVEV